MFFDGGCKLCNREVIHYRRLDQARRVLWLDVSQHPSALDPYPITIKAAFAQLHVIDTTGNIQRGFRGFLTIWEQLPYYRHLAKIFTSLRLIKPMEKSYRVFARWRLRKRCKDQSCGFDVS